MTPTRSAASRKKRNSTAEALDLLNSLMNRNASVADARQTQSANPPRQTRNLPRAPRPDIFDVPISPMPLPKPSPRRSSRLQSNIEVQSSPLKWSNRTNRVDMDHREDSVEEGEDRLPSYRKDHEPVDENEDIDFYGNFNLISDSVGSAPRSPDYRSPTPSVLLRQGLEQAENAEWTSSPNKRKQPNPGPEASIKNKRMKQITSGAYRSTPDRAGPPPSVMINNGLDEVLETPLSKRLPSRSHQRYSPAADNDGDVSSGEDHDVTRNNDQNEYHDDGGLVPEPADSVSSKSSFFVRQDPVPEPETPPSKRQHSADNRARQANKLNRPPTINYTTMHSNSPDSAAPEGRTPPQAVPSGTGRTRSNRAAQPHERSSNPPVGGLERSESNKTYETRGIWNRRSRLVTNYPNQEHRESSWEFGEPEVEVSEPEWDTSDSEREPSRHEEEAPAHDGETDLEREASESARERETEPESETTEPEIISPQHKEALRFGQQQRNWETLIKTEHDIRQNTNTNSTTKETFKDTIDTILFSQHWYEDLCRRSGSSGKLSSKEAQERVKVLRGIFLDGDRFMDDIFDLIDHHRKSAHKRGRKLFDGFEANIIPAMIQLVFAVFDAYHSHHQRFPAVYDHLHEALKVLSWFCTRMNALAMEKNMRCRTRAQDLVKPLQELVNASESDSLKEPKSDSSDQDGQPETHQDRRWPLPAVPRRPWTDAEGAALFAGLRRHQGLGRYGMILGDFRELKGRSIRELREMAQEKGGQILNNMRDQISTPEGREEWRWLLSVREKYTDADAV
ncbi:hypothetical protein BDV12DRAFT_167853 [Aspergillus spectabilis]